MIRKNMAISHVYILLLLSLATLNPQNTQTTDFTCTGFMWPLGKALMTLDTSIFP